MAWPKREAAGPEYLTLFKDGGTPWVSGPLPRVQGLQVSVGRPAQQKWGHSLGLGSEVSLRSACVSLDECV